MRYRHLFVKENDSVEITEMLFYKKFRESNVFTKQVAELVDFMNFFVEHSVEKREISHQNFFS